jgi:hypothetical protein
LRAQECGYHSDTVATGNPAFLSCDSQQAYQFTTNLKNYTPVKRFRLVFHIIRKSDGTGNNVRPWQHISGLQAQRNYLRNYLINAGVQEAQAYNHFSVNYIYHTNKDSAFKSPSWTDSIRLRDTRIAFRLDSIIFHNSDFYYKHMCVANRDSANILHGKSSEYVYEFYNKFIKRSEPDTAWYDSEINMPQLPDSLRYDAIHVIVSYGDGWAGQGDDVARGFTNWLFLDLQCIWMSRFSYFFPGLLAHELGHCFGLDHTDTSTVLNGRSCSYSSLNATPNLMAYRDQLEIDSCQIGFIHHRLMNRNIHGGVDHFPKIIKDYCHYHPSATITIHTGEDVVWTDKKLLWGDVVVAPGGKLTIKCSVSLPRGACILVRRGAQLIVDGGTITNLCDGQMWQGIVVEGNPNLPQTNFTSNGQGRVTLINGATIEHARYGIFAARVLDANYQTFDHAYTGGIVQATGAIFRDNMFQVTLWPTQRGVNTASSFTGCIFEATRPPKDQARYGTSQTTKHETKFHLIVWGHSNLPVSGAVRRAMGPA